jgi:hypothetical protein
MKPTEAAKIIGCTPQQVRTLCRKGTIKATKRITKLGPYWEIAKKEAERYRDKEQKGGFPRGYTRG